MELVSEAGDVVRGFSLDTGARPWSSQVIGAGKAPSTVVGEGLVFTAGGWGGRESIKAFRLGGRGDLTEDNLFYIGTCLAGRRMSQSISGSRARMLAACNCSRALAASCAAENSARS